MARDSSAAQDAQSQGHTDAGFWPRVGAKLIDHGLWAPVQVVCVGAAAYLNAKGVHPGVLAAGFVAPAVLWYLYVYEMTRRRGQTVGKMAAGIRVIAEEGSLPTAGVVGRRVLVEALFDSAGIIFMALAWVVARRGEMEPAPLVVVGMTVGSLIALVDPLAVTVTARRRAIHDTAAGTFVVRTGGSSIGGFALLAVIGAAAEPALTFGVVRPMFVEAYVVPSGSMEDTIQIGDRILANKLLPRLRAPRDGEIVMFQAPDYVASVQPRHKPLVFVKRVVGVAGDELEVRDGVLVRNGSRVDEPYIRGPMAYAWPQGESPAKVPEGHVIVFGDNRNDSNDSHLWSRVSGNGRQVEAAPFLPTEAIRGRLMYRFWPPDRVGTVEQGE